MKYLDDIGFAYFWGKLKAYFAPKVHTHNAFETKHSYTTAANAAKGWYRIANANTSQIDTTKPIHAQFILTAYNTSYDADYYERWFVNAEVFGRNAHIVIFGNTSVPFSQARILYENTIADLDVNDRPAIDIYLNHVLPNGTTKIEIEEVYNQGWTFLADGQLAASTVPSGFENVACSVRNNGVERSTYADYVPYLNRQISNFTAAFTLADSYLYRSRTLNCTGTFTITIPSINSGYMWCVIKNKNTTSGVITLHPSTTSVLIDGSNADITLQPGEYVCIHSAGANNYSLIADGRWKSQKANDTNVIHKTGNEFIQGIKVFKQPSIVLQQPDLTIDELPSDNKYLEIFFADKNYDPATSANANHTPEISPAPTRFGEIQWCRNADGIDSIELTLRRLDPEDNTQTIWGNFGIYYDPSVGFYGCCPSTSNQRNGGTDIVTRDWIPKDTRIVHTTGGETISGNKTFDGVITASTVSTSDNSTKIATTEWVRSATGSTSLNAANVTGTVSIAHGGTGATTAIEAMNAIGAGEYYSSGSYNLDSFRQTGIYSFSSGTTITNIPTGSNGTLIVFSTNSGIVRQLWIRTGTLNSSDHNFYFRTYVSNTWSNWHRIYTDSDIIPIINGGTGSSTKNFVDLSSSQTISAEKIFPDGNVGLKIGGSNGASVKLYRNTHTLGREVSSNQYTTLISVDSADQPVGQINLVRFATRTAIRLRASNLIPGETEGSTQQIESEFQIGAWDDGHVSAQVSANFYPATNNVHSLGTDARRWTEVFAVSGTINVSDERLKTSIESIPDEVLDAWGDVGWVQYRLRDSVEKKGPDARLHNGLIAQRIDAVFRSHGLNAADYGLFCYDKWDEQYDDISEVIKEAVLDENGNEIEPAVIKKAIEHTEAGDAYSLRYEEALSMEASYLRRENVRLKKRVSDLEDRLEALELRLGSA